VRDRQHRPAPTADPLVELELPPPPRIRAEHNPRVVPAGQKVDPLSPPNLFELPGPPGHFSFEGVSFSYPSSWEMTAPSGYWGLVGNNLWQIPIGIDSLNRVLIMANYSPMQYSTKQMRTVAQTVLESVVEPHNGQILRQPSRVQSAGVTMHWADFTGHEPSGAEVVTRMYLFNWNDVEYYFACQETLGSRARIIRGCDRIISTLRLGAS
jgi:hypothetical protein